MPCIWGQHNHRQLFLAVVIIDPQIPNLLAVPMGGVHDGPVHAFRALVDTGATTTCISPAVAQKVGLQPIGKIQVAGVGGVVAHNSYLFYVGFPFALPTGGAPPQLPAPTAAQAQGQIFFVNEPVQGSEFAAPKGFDVLLGMDVLSTGSLVVQGNNTFSFSF